MSEGAHSRDGGQPSDALSPSEFEPHGSWLPKRLSHRIADGYPSNAKYRFSREHPQDTDETAKEQRRLQEVDAEIRRGFRQMTDIRMDTLVGVSADLDGSDSCHSRMTLGNRCSPRGKTPCIRALSADALSRPENVMRRALDQRDQFTRDGIRLGGLGKREEKVLRGKLR